jgi:hypothetical protein
MSGGKMRQIRSHFALTVIIIRYDWIAQKQWEAISVLEQISYDC